MSDVPILEAQHELACGNNLGEGVLWDSQTKLLHWVDINEAEIHSYDPATKAYCIDSYKEQTKFIGTIALRKDKPGFIGATQHDLTFFPAPPRPTEPFNPSSPPKAVPRKAEIVASFLPPDPVKGKPTRFNDGGCDPLGNFIVGSMTIPEVGDGTKRGQLWKYEPNGKSTMWIEAVGTSNGLGWTLDGTTMYYIDSADHEVLKFDYSNGQLDSRKVIVPTDPTPIPPFEKNTGVFDGLCVDGIGNVWVARWSEARVIGYSPDGEVICQIRVPKCKNTTIPCFGGDNLETMYIVSAHARNGGNGEIQDKYPHSGDLFTVDFGPNSEIRKILPENWKGAERFRFDG